MWFKVYAFSVITYENHKHLEFCISVILTVTSNSAVLSTFHDLNILILWYCEGGRYTSHFNFFWRFLEGGYNYISLKQMNYFYKKSIQFYNCQLYHILRLNLWSKYYFWRSQELCSDKLCLISSHLLKHDRRSSSLLTIWSPKDIHFMTNNWPVQLIPDLPYRCLYWNHKN